MSARSCHASGCVPLRRELARDHVREREVHVVAAEQDVFADRHAMQFKVALALDHRDQREVGRAAAHIDHENDVADLDLLAPVGRRSSESSYSSAACGSSSSVMRP